MKSKVRTFIDEKDSLTAEHQDLTKRKSRLELDIKDIQDELDGNKSGKVSVENNVFASEKIIPF